MEFLSLRVLFPVGTALVLGACSHDWDALDEGASSGGGGQSSGAQGGDAGSTASHAGPGGGGASGEGGGGGTGGSPSAGAGGTGGSGAVTYASCKDLLAAVPGTPNGVYALGSSGPGSQPYDAYCDMTEAGGGFTLALKADGTQTTFAFASPLWENATLHQPEFPGLDTNEAKLRSFVTVPFDEVLVGMVDGGTTRRVRVTKSGTSLQALFSGATFSATTLGRNGWKGLVGSPSLQLSCNREGFNVACDDAGSARVRIGIATNEQVTCNSCDSFLGLGGDDACGQNDVGSGNIACFSADAGDKNTRTFGYLMVR